MGACWAQEYGRRCVVVREIVVYTQLTLSYRLLVTHCRMTYSALSVSIQGTGSHAHSVYSRELLAQLQLPEYITQQQSQNTYILLSLL